MSPEQFELINRLFQLTFQIGDRLGCESSDPAQLLLTDRPSLEANHLYFPSDYVYEALDPEVLLEEIYIDSGALRPRMPVSTLNKTCRVACTNWMRA